MSSYLWLRNMYLAPPSISILCASRSVNLGLQNNKIENLCTINFHLTWLIWKKILWLHSCPIFQNIWYVSLNDYFLWLSYPHLSGKDNVPVYKYISFGVNNQIRSCPIWFLRMITTMINTLEITSDFSEW